MTTSPFTTTVEMPVAYWWGSSVATSATVSGSKTVTSVLMVYDSVTC